MRFKTFAHPRDVDEILTRLSALRADTPRRWGRMTAHQAVCHMRDAFLMGTDAKPISAAGGRLQHTFVKWAALYAPVRWPPGIMTRPELDQEIGGTRPATFDEDAAGLAALIRHVARTPGFFRGRAHPILGPLSESAWLRWSYLHTDHHLRQFGIGAPRA